MTQNEVHAIYGEPDETASEYAEWTETYYDHYDLRPVGYDTEGVWLDTTNLIISEVDYSSALDVF